MEIKKVGLLNASLIGVMLYLYRAFENPRVAENPVIPPGIQNTQAGAVSLRLCCLMMFFSVFHKAYLYIMMIGSISFLLYSQMEQYADFVLIFFLVVYSAIAVYENQKWTTSVIGTLTLTSACFATTDMAHHGLVHIYNKDVHGVFLWDLSMIDITGFKSIMPIVIAMYIKIYEILSKPYETKEENFINLFTFHCIFNGVTILAQVFITTVARVTGDVWYFNPLSGEAIDQDLNFLDWHVVGVMTCSAVVWTIAYFRLCHWKGTKLSPAINTFQKILVNMVFPVIQIAMTISGVMLTIERQKNKRCIDSLEYCIWKFLLYVWYDLLLQF